MEEGKGGQLGAVAPIPTATATSEAIRLWLGRILKF